jgi:hypothetical protein
VWPPIFTLFQSANWGIIIRARRVCTKAIEAEEFDAHPQMGTSITVIVWAPISHGRKWHTFPNMQIVEALGHDIRGGNPELLDLLGFTKSHTIVSPSTSLTSPFLFAI